MIHNNTNEMTRIDQNRLLQILLWSRFHGFPEAAGAAVRALAGLPARSAAQQFPTRDDAQRIAIEALLCLAVSACLDAKSWP